jgi:hypothetical protein
MGNAETNHSNEGQTTRQPEMIDSLDTETARREAELIETAHRWGKAVTAAEHKAIYESSARDVAGWLERRGQQEAS